MKKKKKKDKGIKILNSSFSATSPYHPTTVSQTQRNYSFWAAACHYRFPVALVEATVVAKTAWTSTDYGQVHTPEQGHSRTVLVQARDTALMLLGLLAFGEGDLVVMVVVGDAERVC